MNPVYNWFSYVLPKVPKLFVPYHTQSYVLIT